MSRALPVRSSESSLANGWMRPCTSTGAMPSTLAVSATSPACLADIAETLPATSVRLAE